MLQNKSKNKATKAGPSADSREVNPSWLLRLFDKCSGILVDVFDPRLLLPFVALLIGYTVFFAQRKFPGRWMEFVGLGMVLVGLVALTARTPGFLGRIRWHRGMAVLWFALHACMLVAGFFNEDWLPDTMALLLAYPFLFAVLSARDDTSTFFAITRGAVAAVLPFVAWSLITRPLTFAPPGYYGIFYNPNSLAMCADLMSICALLLAYAHFRQGHRLRALLYTVISVVGSIVIAATLARSSWATFIGVLLVLFGCIFLHRSQHVGRVVAIMACVTLIAGGALGYATYVKVRELAKEDEASIEHFNQFGPDDLKAPLEPADERAFSLSDLSSMRTSIWRYALTNLTWNGHPQSIIVEWQQAIGFYDLNRNAHNSFIQVAYNYGWPAGILFALYVCLSAYRAWIYYWRRRRTEVMAIAPLLITTFFVIESLFESVYTPFSVAGCAYLLMQGVLWRKDLSGKEPAA